MIAEKYKNILMWLIPVARLDDIHKWGIAYLEFPFKKRKTMSYRGHKKSIEGSELLNCQMICSRRLSALATKMSF